MQDIISCFGKIAEDNGWKITKCDDCKYMVESIFDGICIEPYQFEVSDGGHPVTLAAFADRVCGEYEDFDISKETYSRLGSDGYCNFDSSYTLEDVCLSVKRVRNHLNAFQSALADKYAQIKLDIEFFNEPHTALERGLRALNGVLDDDALSEGEIVDMMYCLVRNVAGYAVSHNSSKTNHTARELFGATFSEEVLKCFDET